MFVQGIVHQGYTGGKLLIAEDCGLLPEFAEIEAAGFLLLMAVKADLRQVRGHDVMFVVVS